MKAGRVYKRFKAADGKEVILRVAKWEDLDGLLAFINALYDEKRRDRNSSLYTGFDRKISRDEEAEWLAETLAGVEKGTTVNVVAEVSGRIIANGEVERGGYDDTHHHGRLALTMISEYRGLGVGRKIIETLVRESRKAGLKTLQVEFLSSNETARKAYEKAGFRQAGTIPGKVFRNGRYLDGLIMSAEL